MTGQRNKFKIKRNNFIEQGFLILFWVIDPFGNKIKAFPWEMRMHTHMHTCAHTTHTHAHVRSHTHTRAHIDTHIHTHMHTLTHAHTHMHTHALSHTHTQTHARTHTILVIFRRSLFVYFSSAESSGETEPRVSITRKRNIQVNCLVAHGPRSCSGCLWGGKSKKSK